MDRRAPELSWELAGAAEKHSRQTAWQVCVSSSRENAASWIGDLWDSGRVAGEEGRKTCYIAYDGRPLESRQECFWRVRCWDESDEVIESGVASWTMGLLDSSDWQGYWIGRDTLPENPAEVFGSARWIWSAQQEPGLVILETDFDRAPDQPDWGLLWALADDEAEIFLNGHPMGQAARAQGTACLYPLPTPIAVRGLKPGRNTLTFHARKRHDRDPHAGVIARLCLGAKEVVVVRKEFGNELQTRKWEGAQEVVTGGDWRVVSGEGGIRELGSYGIAPWLLQSYEYPNLPARYLKKSFEVGRPCKRAVMYFSGLGLSEAFLNGQRVGDEVLAPHATDYSARVFYRTFDVTEFLRAGRNDIGCILGNGRYFAPRGRIPFPMESYGCPKLLFQLEIQYDDGSREVVVSDSSWKISTDGEIGWNNEFDGEFCDARRRSPEWSSPGFGQWEWHAAAIVAAPMGKLEAPATEPIRVAEIIPLQKAWTTKYGSTILDFGVNLVGWCRAKIKGEASDTIRLQHAEGLASDDTLAMENLRSALCTDTLVLGEGETAFEPKFTYHGFRYVEVRGERSQPELKDVVACFVHDDVERTGDFSCSNDTVTKIVEAAARGIVGNYRSMPTDCPQRDERMGWLGDRGGGAPGEMFLFDVQKHYRKWLADIRLAQAPNGCLPDIAPPFWRMYNDDVTWPSCFVLISHWLHRHYGDRAVVGENFPAISKWLDHMCGYLENDLISRDVFGDWCVPPESRHLIHSERADRKTSPVILSSTYLARLLEMAATFARMLGNDDDAARWTGRHAEISAALNARFLDASRGSYDNGSQTAALLPLAFGITPEAERRKVFDYLVGRITEGGSAQLGTGLIGGQWLMRTLTAYGRADLARELATREEYPGWGYMMSQGATTIWELWNGNTADPLMNSGNHVMLLGDLISWLFEDVAGIQPAEPGFSTIRFRPHFLFRSVACRHHTIRGMASSSWDSTERNVSWEVEVPANVTGIAELPPGTSTHLRLDGQAPPASNGGSCIRIPLEPGRHTITFANTGLCAAG